jgi:hypothetical protein
MLNYASDFEGSTGAGAVVVADVTITSLFTHSIALSISLFVDK